MEMLWILLFGILLAFATLLPAAAMKVHLTQRLVELREYYRKMTGRLESESLDARFSVDRDGRVRSFNHRAEYLFGYHSSEIIEKSVDRLIHGSKNVLPQNFVESLYKGNKRSADKQALEVVGIRKDNSFFPMELHISETGSYINRKYYLTARDLTERQMGLEAAREMKMLGAMLHCAGAPILILNAEGQITRHNGIFEKLSGYGFEEIQNRKFWELLLPAEEWEQAKSDLRNLIGRAGASNQRMEWKFKSGRRQEFYVSAAGVPLHEIKTAEDTPMAPAAMLVGFQVRGTEQMHSGRWVESSGVARDLAAAMATISGKCELLLHLLEEHDPVRRDVEEIRMAGERALDLSSQLVEASAVTAEKDSEFSLHDVVSGLRPMLTTVLGEDIQLSIPQPVEDFKVAADRRTMEHVILNLAVNAREAMPEGGKLTVMTSMERLDAATAHRTARLPEGEYGVVTITDSGQATNLVQRARAFDPTIGVAATRGGGASASLAALMNAIREQGGNAVIQSIPSTGTTVKVYVPAAEAKGLFLVRSSAAAG